MDAKLQLMLTQRDVEGLVARCAKDVAVKLPQSPTCFGLEDAATLIRDGFFDAVTNVYTYESMMIVDGTKDHAPMQMKVKHDGSTIRSLYATTNTSVPRHRLTMAYQGTQYEGFQRQPHRRTIQDALEKALETVIASPVQVHPASRTDAGVHATHQVVHADFDSPVDHVTLQMLLNRRLPDDIRITRVDAVPHVFHARHDATAKTYRYRLMHTPDPFRTFVATYHDTIDLDDLNARLHAFVGTHDFRNFAKSEGKKTVRTITMARAVQEADETIIEITGAGFLRHMVRMMVARVLTDLSRQENTVLNALTQPNMTWQKPLAPAQGLCLTHIEY